VHRPSLPRRRAAAKSIAMKKALFVAMEVASSLSCIHPGNFPDSSPEPGPPTMTKEQVSNDSTSRSDLEV
jgi:hypothetical protein